jgi:hypothetical protein
MISRASHFVFSGWDGNRTANRGIVTAGKIAQRESFFAAF